MYQRFLLFIMNIFSLPLYWISLVSPRSKTIWIFGAWSGHSYTDNSKWLFEYICQKEPQIRAIWLTREPSIVKEINEKGYEAYLASSFRGYWLSCRAGLAVACCGNLDVNRVGIGRAKKLQLWHGSPMKKIGLDEKLSADRESNILVMFKKLWQSFFPFVIERWDIVISCSEFFKKPMASAMGVDLKNVKVTGYPRNDILVNQDLSCNLFIEKLKNKHNAKKVILYAPTHRKKGNENFNLVDNMPYLKFEDMLEETDSILLIKMHYVHMDQKQSRPNIKADSRVVWVKKEEVPEINPLLNFTDILLTDYSGVYFDYLLLDRPVIFTPFDLKEYLEGDREMYDEYSNFAIAGPKCKSWGEVINACNEILCGNDKYKSERMLAKKTFNSFFDSNNSYRVLKVAKDLVGLKY